MKRILLSMTAAAIFSVAANAETIAQREQNQQARIAQGIQSGALTPAEAARLERQETAVDRKIARDRRDGGAFTRRERIRDEKLLNRESRRIYRQKHDGQHF